MAKAKAKTNESARERFLRMAPPRVDAALKRISLLGNFAHKTYDYEPSEAKQVVDALEAAVADVKQKLTRTKVSAKERGFSFGRRVAASA